MRIKTTSSGMATFNKTGGFQFLHIGH